MYNGTTQYETGVTKNASKGPGPGNAKGAGVDVLHEVEAGANQGPKDRENNTHSHTTPHHPTHQATRAHTLNEHDSREGGDNRREGPHSAHREERNGREGGRRRP